MPKDNFLKVLFVISLAITILIPVINIYFIYPSFTGLLIETTEEEAERTAEHLQSMLLSGMKDIKKQYIPSDLPEKAGRSQKDFEFIKLKLFSREGEVIYSTEAGDIGEINKNDYFHQIVVKGRKYTKVVKKDTTSLEGRIAKSDVVETYVPIMREGSFTGAFEIYYDITGRYQKLKNAILYFSLLPMLMMLVFLYVITVTIFKLDKKIIEQKRAETETIMYAEKLRMSNKELEEFAYIASHDLQEPLRKIMAFGDRLKDKYAEALDEQGRDYLGRMQNAARRMQSLINGLLAYSRVATKGQPFGPVDLSAVTKEVLSDLEVRIQEAGGVVEVASLPTLEADPLQMRQLFQNLIGNALKFHKKDEPPLVRISGELIQGPEDNADKSYQIIVEDNGIGFDGKYTDRIFGVFQRLHGRQEYEGTGIGLSVCKKIVERHGGKITAESAPGDGARFILSIPVKQKDNDGGSYG